MYESGQGEAGGADVVVYVIDTGVRSTHEQFGPFFEGQGRAYTSQDYDFVDSRGGEDCDGHGTHCSGTVAGLDYGVAPGAHVVGVRVLDCSGSGLWSGVIAGINKVAQDCRTGFATGPGTQGTPFAGKRCVASMSLGGGESDSVNTAVANLRSKDVVVAVAAGNNNKDACDYSPASAAEAFTVGSTTSSDARSSFSNYGTCVDIFAPGTDILSALHTSDTASDTWSGTSMASTSLSVIYIIDGTSMMLQDGHVLMLSRMRLYAFSYRKFYLSSFYSLSFNLFSSSRCWCGCSHPQRGCQSHCGPGRVKDAPQRWCRQNLQRRSGLA